MITPNYLKSGDTIGIVAPGAAVEKAKIENAVSILNKNGFNVILGKYLTNNSEYLAGTDEQRIKDFQDMLDNDEVKAILCARGGYGSIRVIERLNFSKFNNNPKWIIGFSDITVFHSYLNNVLNTETIHATMPINFAQDAKDENLQSLINAVSGKRIEVKIKPSIYNRTGRAEGLLTGGNLSVLYGMRGLPYDLISIGRILIIEDVGEQLYHIDRMMMNLKNGGVLDTLRGLIIGEMNSMLNTNKPFVKSVYDVIDNICKNYDFPVCYDFPLGHDKNNLTVIMGRKVNLAVENSSVSFIQGV